MRSPRSLRSSNPGLYGTPTKPREEGPSTTATTTPAPTSTSIPGTTVPEKRDKPPRSSSSSSLVGEGFKKSRFLNVSVKDTNRSPMAVELLIRGSYGMLLGSTPAKSPLLKKTAHSPSPLGSKASLFPESSDDEADDAAPPSSFFSSSSSAAAPLPPPANSVSASKYKSSATTPSPSRKNKKSVALVLPSDVDSQLSHLPSWADKSDPLIRTIALSRLESFTQHQAAIVLQTAYRRWTSYQLVHTWTSFNSSLVDHDPSGPSIFQHRLADRALRRLLRRRVTIMFNAWRTLARSFVAIRNRILTCELAARHLRRVRGWKRVVVRQIALKKVVYIQERLVRRRHFRLWRGLTIIKRNMIWVQRRAWKAMRHFQLGAAVELNAKWTELIKRVFRWGQAKALQHWWRGIFAQRRWRRYRNAAYRVKDEIMRRLGKTVFELREAKEIERLSRERATMKKIGRRSVASLRDYIATEEGADEFNLYWRAVRTYRLKLKGVELRKQRLKAKRPRTLFGELKVAIKTHIADAKEAYNDYYTVDWREPAYLCCEERITYEARRLSRENFRREQPPLFDCDKCKQPFVFHFLLRRHKLIFGGECEPKVPDHFEWRKADKFSKASMERIVKIFYSHLVIDRLKGKRGASAALEAESSGAGLEGKIIEGVDAGERKKLTKGWGKIKMAVGDAASAGSGLGEGAKAAASGLKMRLLAAVKKEAQIAPASDDEKLANDVAASEEEEVEEEEKPPPEWCDADEHPQYKKFLQMINVIGKDSVKARMKALGFDETVADDPFCRVGLNNSIYKNKRVPLRILREAGELRQETKEQEDADGSADENSDYESSDDDDKESDKAQEKDGKK